MSYATSIEAQAYFDNRLNTSAWDDALPTDQDIALAQATEIIDQLHFSGEKTVSTQLNEFPRDGETDIPTDVKKASFEIAIALLDGVDPEVEYENLRMMSQSYSTVKSSYDRTVAQPHVLAGIPSATAWRYLVKYMFDTTNLTITRV